MLKSVFTKFLCGLVAFVSIAFCGCSNSISDKNDDLLTMFMLANSKSVQYGSLEVSTESASRALYISNVKYAKATVSGTDISTAITSDFVNVTSGTGSFSITNIPVGNNRIVTVQGYDENKNAISGAYVSNIVNITTGSNSCSVTKDTTALGRVFAKLLSLGVNLSTVDADTFSPYIDSSKSWSLIDSDQIASDYNSSSLSGKSASDYVVTTGTVSLTSTLTNAYKIQITDPSSEGFTMSSSVSSKSVTDAAPGTWCIYALNSDREIVASNNNVKVVSGETTSITVTESTGGSVTGKIVVHVPSSYGYTKAYAWAGDVTSADWPGDAMTLNGDNYDYELNCTSSKIIFNNGSDSNKTNDLYIKEGEWTYNGSNTTDSDGTKVSTNFTEVIGDGTPTVTFSVTNPSTPDDYIIVHAKYKYVYYWTNTVTGTHNAMTAEDDGWYTYTIPLTSCSIIFENDNNFANKTGDLSRSDAGEWWYKDGNWTSYNPDDSVAPVLSSFTADKSGTVSGNVVLSISATDNLTLSKAVLTLDSSTTLANISLSGTSASTTYTWETAYIPNGSHTITCVVYDGGSNTSETKSLTFTTSNANLPPVAVISGASRAVINSEKTYSANSSYDQNGGTIASYSWTVTGATVTSGAGTKSITVTMPSSATSVSVSLTVTDNEGASSESVTKDVVVSENDTSDFRDESIYFLMTTRFYDGDSSNNRYCWGDETHLKSKTNNDPGWRGDFKGLIEKLDYIKALGFTAIWITPVVENASDLDYHGYHAYDFSKIDPRYESNGATYQDLIDACHAKGIKIVQDIVLNHCSNSGERHILPMTEKYYSSDNGTDSVQMIEAKTSKDIYNRNTYDLLNQGVVAVTGGKFSTYEDLRNDTSLSEDVRGGYLYNARIYSMNNGLAIDNEEVGKLFHYAPSFSQWESYEVQVGTMAGDCVDLNTENPKVAQYLRNCYIDYINMGVDGFRIDTLKHISRLTMNKEFIPQFKAAGGDSFFMFGEACVRRCETFNANLPGISVCFYTWNQNSSKTDDSYTWYGVSDYITGAKKNLEMAEQHFYDNDVGSQLTSTNALLNGITYHAPDYSKASGLNCIDFRMHHQFKTADEAFGACLDEDPYFNDSTFNVTYVDSHDYGPNTIEGIRYNQGAAAWAENWSLMFTFRGIPCVYYGSEVEFQAGCQIEPWFNGNKVPYNESGRAYFGDHLEGTVTATGFGDYTASGTVATTLSSDLSKHVRKLNKMRAAVPALRRGQYTTDSNYVSGGKAYIRRYKDSDVDSFACISVSGGATFNNLPAGTYIDVCTGDKKTVSEGGSLTSSCSGQGNLRIYVNASLDPSITGAIGEESPFIN